MTPLHLVRDRLGNIFEGEEALFLGHPSMEDDLKKKIAELVLQRGHVVARDRVGYLISLLDRVRRDCREILLPIPGAAVLRMAQPRHDFEQAIERSHLPANMMGPRGRRP